MPKFALAGAMTLAGFALVFAPVIPPIVWPVCFVIVLAVAALARTRWGALAVALIAFVLAPFAAFAADAAASGVTVPIGDWLGSIAATIAACAAALVAFAFRALPAQLAQMLMAAHADQILAKAVTYGLNTVAGAEKGKTLTIPIANQVIAQAAQYAVDHAPAWLVSWLGGQGKIQQMIIARLDVEPAATATPSGTALAAGK